MKSNKILNWLIGIVLAALIVTIVYAAPGDVTITFTIPVAKVADFKAGFLAKCPVPLIEDENYVVDPNDPNDFIPQIPEYTEKQWIKEWIRRDVMRAYRHGKILLAQQTAVIDPNAIQ